MGNLLIEAQLHADGGPIRSAVEIAVRNRKTKTIPFPLAAGEAPTATPWGTPRRSSVGYVRGRSVSC